MRASVVLIPLFVATVASTPSALTAQNSQNMAITVRAGTQGIGGEVSKLIVPHVGVRLGAEFFSINASRTQTDISYKFSVKLHSLNGLLDLYPGAHGSFHFTVGVVSNPLTGTGTGQPSGSGTFTINHHAYTAGQVGTLTAGLKFSSAAPYVGLGFGTPANKKGGIFFALDLGLRIGKPTFTLAASGASSNAQLASDIAAQQQQSQTDVNKLFGWPVIALGIGYRF